jgi:hypothetical protein
MLSYRLGAPQRCGAEVTLHGNRRLSQAARVADLLPV